MDKNQLSRDHHVIDHFRKKRLFFRDTRQVQEHDAKVRLFISGPSPEKPLAEIDQLKKNRPQTFGQVTNNISTNKSIFSFVGLKIRFPKGKTFMVFGCKYNISCSHSLKQRQPVSWVPFQGFGSKILFEIKITFPSIIF